MTLEIDIQIKRSFGYTVLDVEIEDIYFLQIYFIECVENIRIFASAQHDRKFYCFQLTQDELYCIYRNR